MQPISLTFLVIGAAASLLCTSTAQAQYFVNGNFESVAPGLASGGSVGATTGSPTSSIRGWTTTLGNSTAANVYVNNLNNTSQTWIPNPESGNYCVQLDGSAASNDAKFGGDGTTATPARDSISQLFTEPAGNYTLSFYLNNEVGTNKGGTSGALVSLVGVANGSFTNIEYTVTNPASPTRATSTWTLFTTNFTVTDPAAQITLSFADDPNPALANYKLSSNIAVDNVSIVPEPGVAVSLIAGSAGLLSVIRLRRRVG